MKNQRNVLTFLVLIILCITDLKAQKKEIGKIEGIVKLDSSWSSNIYLSYISTFEDLHSMSNEMIIAQTTLDSKGYFEIELDFLPVDQKLYRLHVSKKDDFKTSLIIGGLNENYIALIADRTSKIELKANSFNPPFKKTTFVSNSENTAFQNVTNLVFTKDSIASKSGLSKRRFIEEKTDEELLAIADSSTNSLVSLYALYQSDFEFNSNSYKEVYKSYLEKWSKVDNSYLNAFKSKLPVNKRDYTFTKIIFISIVLILIGFCIGKIDFQKNNRIKNLSVQERKVFELLKEGATNKEISEKFNIGISTAKSHVSSILNKLKVKSRKEIMDLK